MSDFPLNPPPEITQSKRARLPHPISVVLNFALIVIVAVLCCTAFLFMMLYQGEYLAALLVVILGGFFAVLGYQFWMLHSWAWFATVFLLGMAAIYDFFLIFTDGIFPSLPRSILCLFLLASLLPAKVRNIFDL